jgi:hypothetical protein
VRSLGDHHPQAWCDPGTADLDPAAGEHSGGHGDEAMRSGCGDDLQPVSPARQGQQGRYRHGQDTPGRLNDQGDLHGDPGCGTRSGRPAGYHGEHGRRPGGQRGGPGRA